MLTENTANEQRGRPFKQGQSGNPAGRPKGARNKTTLAVQALLDGEAEEISRKAVELAKTGDITAIRLVLERVLPARKDSPVSFDMPVLTGAQDAAKAMGAVMEAVSSGELTPAEAGEISKLVTAYIEALRTADLENRIKQLEEGKKL